MRAVEVEAMLARNAGMVVGLLVTPAKATAMQAAAVAATPTTVRTRQEEGAGEVVRTGNPALPSSRN